MLEPEPPPLIALMPTPVMELPVTVRPAEFHGTCRSTWHSRRRCNPCRNRVAGDVAGRVLSDLNANLRDQPRRIRAGYGVAGQRDIHVADENARLLEVGDQAVGHGERLVGIRRRVGRVDRLAALDAVERPVGAPPAP
jgi:hypothetical protein